MENPRQKDLRYRLYRLMEVGRKSLGMDEDSFRALLARHGAKVCNGHPSRSTMSMPQLSDVIEEMKQKGFRPRTRTVKSPSDWRRPRIAKITAIWIALAEAGVVRDRSEAAMVKWCARHTKTPRLEWAKSADLNACIEALKDWARRERVELDG